MGTNYYHVVNHCPCCGRQDEYHIGKHSMGWVFGFQAITTPYTIKINAPIGIALKIDHVQSFAEWKEVLQASGYIKDEYGKMITYDDFIALVESTKKNVRSHAIYDGQWSDADGYSFTESDFT